MCMYELLSIVRYDSRVTVPAVTPVYDVSEMVTRELIATLTSCMHATVCACDGGRAFNDQLMCRRPSLPRTCQTRYWML